MSIKSFSFGLGLGMAFVSLLSVVLIKAEVSKVKAENTADVPVQMSDEEIIERAKELGLVSLNDLPSRKDAEESVQSETQKEEINSDTEDNKSENETEVITEKAAEETTILLDNLSNREESGEMVNITITPGSSAGMISVSLQENGLIDDSDDFKRYIVEKGLTKKLATGSFSIPKGADYDEIIEIIRDKN